MQGRITKERLNAVRIAMLGPSLVQRCNNGGRMTEADITGVLQRLNQDGCTGCTREELVKLCDLKVSSMPFTQAERIVAQPQCFQQRPRECSTSLCPAPQARQQLDTEPSEADLEADAVQCPICLVELDEATDTIVRLPACNHFMHKECADQLIADNTRQNQQRRHELPLLCPLDRVEILIYPGHPQGYEIVSVPPPEPEVQPRNLMDVLEAEPVVEEAQQPASPIPLPEPPAPWELPLPDSPVHVPGSPPRVPAFALEAPAQPPAPQPALRQVPFNFFAQLAQDMQNPAIVNTQTNVRGYRNLYQDLQEWLQDQRNNVVPMLSDIALNITLEARYNGLLRLEGSVGIPNYEEIILPAIQNVREEYNLAMTYVPVPRFPVNLLDIPYTAISTVRTEALALPDEGMHNLPRMLHDALVQQQSVFRNLVRPNNENQLMMKLRLVSNFITSYSQLVNIALSFLTLSGLESLNRLRARLEELSTSLHSFERRELHEALGRLSARGGSDIRDTAERVLQRALGRE